VGNRNGRHIQIDAATKIGISPGLKRCEIHTEKRRFCAAPASLADFRPWGSGKDERRCRDFIISSLDTLITDARLAA